MEDLLAEPYSKVVAWKGRDAEGRSLLHVKLGEAVDILNAEQQRAMEPVLVSQCYHGIPALCGAHDPVLDKRGQIAVLVDLKGLSYFKPPPIDIIQSGIVSLGKFFGHHAGVYYLINCPPGAGVLIKLLGWAITHSLLFPA